MWEKAEKAINFIIKTPPSKAIAAKIYIDRFCKQEIQEVQVIFPLAFALHSLGFVPTNKLSPAAQAWIKKAVEFIKDQEKDFSFNYWIRMSKNAANRPLPDDLDDTAFCLSALVKNKIEISEKYFFKILNLEEKEGGPYRTWYLRRDETRPEFKKWVDIDPIVNANFYYFVTLYGLNLPELRKYLINCLKTSKFSSPYYPYNLFFIYALSKAASVAKDNELQNYILKKLKCYELKNLEPMERLLYCLSLSYSGKRVGEKLFGSLLSLQRNDGSLPSLPFCYDDLLSGNHTIISNSTITTALFLELLLLINNKIDKKKVCSVVTKLEELNDLQKELVNDELCEMLRVKEFQRSIPEIFHTPLGTPFGTAMSLEPKITKKDIKVITDLSTAIHFAWCGYTVDDEILDNQRSANDIPLANELKRIGWKYYYKVIRKFPELENPLMEAFKTCDHNYVWEIYNAKFDKSNLNKILNADFGIDYIERRMQPYLISMKYIPLLIGVDEFKAESIYDFYRSQMIIKQLNDDAHDWAEDNDSGIMTYVLYLLYKEKDDPEMHASIFWDKVIYSVAEICGKEYEKANEALSNLDLENNFMKELLDRTYMPVVKAVEEKEKAARIITGVEECGNSG